MSPIKQALTRLTPNKLDRKYPPEEEEPTDADEEQEERRVKPKKPKKPKK